MAVHQSGTAIVKSTRNCMEKSPPGGGGGAGGLLFSQGFIVLANYSMAKPKEYAVPKVGLV